jgi:hypothetical protein
MFLGVIFYILALFFHFHFKNITRENLSCVFNSNSFTSEMCVTLNLITDLKFNITEVLDEDI